MQKTVIVIDSNYSNLQELLIEIFKVKMKLAPEIINKDSSILECTYPLRNELGFKSRNIRNVGSRIWRHVPSELKESTSPNKFRFKIKTWKPENYPCKLVKYTFREPVTYKLLN